MYTDFSDFNQSALKICVEIIDRNKEVLFFDAFQEYDCMKFLDGNWYKITQKNSTKESAVKKVIDHYGLLPKDVVSFGDDLADIGMLKSSGLDITMGNVLDEVKEMADLVIGNYDEDGIACFLEDCL